MSVVVDVLRATLATWMVGVDGAVGRPQIPLGALGRWASWSKGGGMQQNTLTLIGTVASDVIVDAPDGQARFRLVTHSRRLDRATNTWVNGAPAFIDVVCSRRLAENVAACVRRGDPVIVTGRLRMREGPDKRLNRLEIDAQGVGPDLNRATVVVTRHVGRAAA